MENWTETRKGDPVVGEYVLLLLEGETMLKGRLCSNGWSAFFADGEKLVGTREVTHWMYLPALPGAEQKQQPKLSRDEIAAMAMQGILANHWCQNDFKTDIHALGHEHVAKQAIGYANALLQELSKPQP